MDQLYFEDGYYEGKYFVYTASASAGFAPYIADGYLDQGFFEDGGSRSSLVCEGTRVRFVAFDAALASAFAQTTTAKKDARTTVTLSTIANVSAQALKLRQLSSSASAVVTQTVSSVITARAQAIWTSAFSPTITARASVSNGSNFSSNFSLTALTGVRRQFPLNQLTGLGTTSSQYGTIDFNQSLFPAPVGSGLSGGTLSARDNYWTFSVWVKRDTVNGAYQTIAEGLVQEQTGGSSLNNGGIVLKNNDVRIRFNFDADEPGASWQDVAPTDTEWHHYLFRSIINPANETYPVESWNLWIDGVYQGSRTSYFSGRDLQFAGRYGSGNGNLYGGLRLGFGQIAQDEGSREIISSPLLGGVAQVWMGITTDSQFRLERFYSGFVDLGSDGTATGLPTPVFYNKLTDPYTGVTLNPGATPVPSPASTPLGLPSVQARFSLTGNNVTVIENTVNIQSVATISATANRILRNSATMTSTATVSATVVKTVRAVSDFVSTSTMSTVGQRLRFGLSSLTSAATFTATAFKVKPFASTLATVVTTSITGLRIRSVSETLTGRFTAFAQPTDRTRDAIALQAGAFSLNITYTRIRPGAGAITATATATTSSLSVKRAVGTLRSAFTLTADAKKVIVNTANLTASFAITSIIFRAVIAQANLSANGFVLTQGDILNFDPCREIPVDPETRLARLLPESRLLIVESETRRLKVPQETRVLKVEFETRVNIIKC
jgi:hypothetical protein